MSGASAPAIGADGPKGLLSISARQWLVLLTIQTSTLLFGMTLTIANVVLPQMRGALSATQDEISWVITFNLVATAVATLPSLASHTSATVGRPTSRPIQMPTTCGA